MPSKENPKDTAPKPDRELEPENVAGRAIIISGGTRGIGRATARLLVARGGRVLIYGRHQDALDDAVASAREVGGGEIYGVLADSSKAEDIEHVFAEADRHLGGLDILVNNAALGAGSINDTSLDEIRYVLDTNLLGYIVCTKLACERMRKAGHGHIVNVGSMSADVKEPDSSLYVATKAAIRGLSGSLRKEVNPFGIKVSLIEPGNVGTDMQEVPVNEQADLERRGEMLKAEDIAEAVYYCLIQPARCDVVALQIRPHLQPI